MLSLWQRGVREEPVIASCLNSRVYECMYEHLDLYFMRFNCIAINSISNAFCYVWYTLSM